MGATKLFADFPYALVRPTPNPLWFFGRGMHNFKSLNILDIKYELKVSI